MRSENNIALKLSKLTESEYKSFSNYCLNIDKGLRKEAFKELDDFLELASNWNFESKFKFCKTLFSLTKSNNDLDIILTYKLRLHLVEKTLLEMISKFSDNSLYHYYYGQYFYNVNHLKIAFDLNSKHELTIESLKNIIENELWYSTHHLPEHYLGDFDNDSDNLELGFKICNQLSGQQKNDFKTRLEDYKKEIEVYISRHN